MPGSCRKDREKQISSEAQSTLAVGNGNHDIRQVASSGSAQRKQVID
jgi:hypothetical protein